MPERLLDILLAAGGLLLTVGLLEGDWPLRCTIAGAGTIAAALWMAWRAP